MRDIGKNRRSRRGLFAGLIAAALTVQSAFPVMAMPPYDTIPEGCSEETWNRMQDNLIEYDELGDLVQYYNPSYTKAMDSASGSVETLSFAVDQFNMYFRDLDLNDSIDQLKTTVKGLDSALSNPNLSSSDKAAYQQQLAVLNTNLATAEASEKTMKSTIRSMSQTVRNTKKSVEIQLRPVKDQLEFAMQSVFIQYHQLQINKAILEEQKALYQTILNTNTNTANNGMSTETERMSAENNLLSADIQLEQVNSGIDTIRRSMGLQLGWGADTLPDIGELPEPDVDFVDTTNPDADKTAALMHNSSMRDVERYSGGQAQRDVTDRQTEEQHGKLNATMDSLYADMKNKKALYTAAQTSMQRAQLQKAAADRQYALGMLGNSEYEALNMSYISTEASYKLAKLNLFSAINTYKWAVDGVVTLE